MATASTGWYCAVSASVTAQTDTTATITVTCYWQNDGWNYNIGNVSAWVYCNGSSYQVKNDGTINSTASNTAKVSCGSHAFTINKSTAAQSISCYAKITASSSYVSGTKTSSTVKVSVAKKTSYTVSYNANGGTGAPSSQTKWYGTALALSTTKPTRTGHTFKGWATSASGSVAYASGASYTANASASLYAVWQANTYTVSYNANGGTGAPANQTKTYGVDLTLSNTKPTRANYNFKGWGTSATSTSAAYASGASYTANAAITLYAVWELAYTKPRITNYSAVRCDSSGNPTESGTNALVQFGWSTDKAVSSITINWKLVTSETWTNSATVTASGTSGTVSQIIGNNLLDAENMYDVQIVVADSVDSSESKRTLNGASYPIDILAGGSGVAIGKAATLENVLDVYKQTIIRGDEDAGSTTASGQLIVGDPQGFHLAFDNNEIMAKKNANEPNGISINYDGGSVGIGGETGNITLKGEYVSALSNIRMATGTALYGLNTESTPRSIVQLNASGQYVFGYGGYSNNEGAAYYDGNSVNIRSKGAVAITSPTAGLTARHYGVNKVLWSGGYYMTADHTATLSEAISAQPHGVVLVFSQYSGGAQDRGFNYFFVPKWHGENKSGCYLNFTMNYGAYLYRKLLYVYDTKIVGVADNGASAYSFHGTTVDNRTMVLREVIGV